MRSETREMYLCAVAIALAILPGTALGADTTAADNTNQQSQPITLFGNGSTNSKLFTFDYSVPTSPALQLAGVSSSAESTTDSLKPFILSLPGLLSTNSADQSAALDVSAGWALNMGSDKTTGSYYDDNATGEWFRLAYRTHLDVAAYKGDNGDGVAAKQKDSKVAAGFSVSLLDSSDPLMAIAPGQKLIAGQTHLQSAWLACLADNGQLKTEQASESWQKLALISGPLGGPNPSVTGDSEVSLLNQAESVLDSAKQLSGDRKARAAEATEQRRRDDLADLAKAMQQQPTADQNTVKAISTCSQTASSVAQHNAALDFGLGVVVDGKPGEISGEKDPGFAVWLSGRYPVQQIFDRNDGTPCQAKDNSTSVTGSDAASGNRSELACWMIGGAARGALGEFVSTGDTTTPTVRANDFNGWIGIQRVDDNSSFALQGGYLDQKALGAADSKFTESGLRWLASGSLALKNLPALWGGSSDTDILNGMWLVASYGTSQGTVSALKGTTFLVTLNFSAPKSTDLFGGGSSSDTSGSGGSSGGGGGHGG